MPEFKSTSQHILNASEQADTLQVALTGEIDLNSSAALREDLLRWLGTGDYKHLVVDLAKVPYVDSSAIAVMVEMLQRLRKANGTVQLNNLTPRVKGIIEIAHLQAFFKIGTTNA